MKKIINGKRYDTDTATEVADWSNGLAYSDFKHCGETLYRTPKGNWFTVGYGGPMTRYAVAVGNSGRSGSRDVFRTLTSDKAREWLEGRGETDALEEHFAEAIQDA